MRSSLFKASIVIALVVALGVVFAQNVGALRGESWDLPRTDTDRRMISAVFNAVDAVQVECSESLKASLAEEGAYAACGVYDSSPHRAELERNRVSRVSTVMVGGWDGAWRENPEFGVVRGLSLYSDLTSYFVALDQPKGIVYVIRFE